MALSLVKPTAANQEPKTLQPRRYAPRRVSQKEIVQTRIRWDNSVIEGVRSTIYRHDSLTFPGTVENQRRIGAMKWRCIEKGLKLHVVTDPIKNLIHVWAEDE